MFRVACKQVRQSDHGAYQLSLPLTQLPGDEDVTCQAEGSVWAMGDGNE